MARLADILKDPPVSPISLKAGRKTRRKGRHSPYTRLALPTPSSPSEVEFDFRAQHSPFSPPKFTKAHSPNGVNATDMEYQSTSEYVMRIIRESPFEEGKFVAGKEEREEYFPSSVFSLSPEPAEAAVTLPNLETMTLEKQETVSGDLDVGMAENDQEVGLREDSMEESQSLEVNDISNQSEALENMPPEDSKEDTNEDQPPQKPLAYGDLVVVNYAERKKCYKWPAIVIPNSAWGF
jgi:hypothetical protein